MSVPVPVPIGYTETLERLKHEIGAARARAVLAVNEELVGLYWRIGHEILRRQRDESWGAQVIQRLADDLRAHFPDLKGLSLELGAGFAFVGSQVPLDVDGEDFYIDLLFSTSRPTATWSSI